MTATMPTRLPGQSRPTADVLAIVGSGSFDHPGGLGIAAKIIDAVLDTQRPDLVLGEYLMGVAAGGVATLVEQAARTRGIEYKGINASVRRWQGRGGYQFRAHQIGEHCSRLLWVYCAVTGNGGKAWYPAWVARRNGREIQEIPIGGRA